MTTYNKVLSKIFYIRNFELFKDPHLWRRANKDTLLHNNKILCWERGTINYENPEIPKCNLSYNYYINDGKTSQPFFKTSTENLENTDFLVTTKTLGDVETKTCFNLRGIRTYKERKTVLPDGTVSMERYKYNEKGVNPTPID